jgi:hypothetical protein
MRVSFTDHYDQTLQFHDIKHHFKPIWITVWFPKDQSCHHSLSLQSPTIQMLPSFHFSPYLHTLAMKGTIYIKFCRDIATTTQTLDPKLPIVEL